MPDEPAGEETPEGDEPEGDEGGEEQSLEDQLAEARKEAATLKRSNAALKAQADRAKKSGKKAAETDDGPSERELQLQKELEESQARADALEMRFHKSAAATIAKGMDAHDGDFVAEAIDWDEIADPGDEREVKQAIARLKKSRPFLFKKTDVDHGEGKSHESGGDMNRLIRRGFAGGE